MPRRLPVALGAAGLLLAGVVAPVGSITAQAHPATRTESREIDSRVSPQSGTPADGIVGEWSSVAGGLDDVVNAMTFWDDTLVAGGNFSGTLDHIGALSANDDTWIPLGSGSPGLGDDVDALTVWDGDLIAGGAFRSSSNDDTLNYIGVLSAPNAPWRGLGQADDTGLDDRVYSLTVLGDRLVAGGDFTSTFDGSVTLNNVGAFSGLDDTWLRLGPNSDPGLSGDVLALTTWNDTLVAGGGFETTWDNSVDLNFVGAFDDTDDTWVGLPSGNPGMDAFMGAPPPVVRAADTLDQWLVVGGDFEEAKQQGPRDLDYVGLYSPTTQSWMDLDGGVDDPVYELAVDDTRSLIYVGGVFEDADDLARSIAVWDAGVEQWVSFVWGSGDDSVGILNGGLGAEVRAIALDDSVVYVGGDFGNAAPEAAGTANIARWTWDPPQGDGSYVGSSGQRIRIIGDGFIGMTADDTPTIGGVPVAAYTRISATEISLTVPPGAFDESPIEVAAVGGTSEVGTFTSVPAPPDLGDWSALQGDLQGPVYSLVLWDDSLVAGGEFECALTWPEVACNGDDTLNYIGIYSSQDDTWTPLGPADAPGLGGRVIVVGLFDDTLVAGGAFVSTFDGGVLLEDVGAYSVADDTWVPIGSLPGVPDGQVYALTQWDDSLVVGGSFHDGTGCSDLSGIDCVALFPRGSSLSAMGPGLDDFVYALATHDDTVYAGGGFGGWGTPPFHVSAFNPATAAWYPVGTGLDDVAGALAMLDATLIAAGSFTATNDDAVDLSHIGAYSSQEDTWSPLGAGLDRYTDAIGVDDVRSLVYAGGDFGAEQGDQPGSMQRVGVWDAVLGEWIPFTFGEGLRNGIDDNRAGSSVDAIAADDSVVYVGGYFPVGIEEYPGTRNIARWTWDPPQGANSLSAAGGATVTITGAGFIGMSPTDTVRFGTTPVTSLTRISSTQLRVVVPPGTFTNAPIYVDAVGGRGQVGTFSTASGPGPGPTPLNPPSRPVNVKATPGDRQASITWSPPVNSGSFPITRYEVRSTPAGGTCLVAALTCTITGLTNGTAYTFEARALNGAGWGPWSTPSNTVTPVAPPPPPSITITGSRGTGAERQVVFITGTSTGLDGEQVRAHVKLRGQAAYRPGRIVGVSTDGRFEWQRTTGKKTYVYFTGGDVRSNRIIIPASRR